MRNLVLILGILAALVGAYFAVGHYLWGDLGEATLPEESPEESGNIRLEGSSWQWEYTELHTGERVEAPAGHEFVLSFAADGRMESTTDCNQVGGVYIEDGEVLSLGQFVMTKMFCSDSLEATYVEHLGLVNSFTLDGGVLTMNLNRDYGTMIFTKQ